MLIELEKSEKERTLKDKYAFYNSIRVQIYLNHIYMRFKRGAR